MPTQWLGLAIDLGASSGRVIAGRFDGQRLAMEELHRFPNDPVQVHDTLHWDFLRIFHEIKVGLRKGALAAKDAGETVASIGLDTWGVDFGLLDERGRLLGNPVHYRDARNDGALEKVFARVPAEELYAIAGIQFMQFNTICQLEAMRAAGDPDLSRADAILLAPDLLHYWLTGVKANEHSEASTSSLLDAATGEWSSELIERMGLRREMFQRIIRPGEVVGPLLGSLAPELAGLQAPVVAVATHDTGSAVVSVPASTPNFAYLSCGTWSLLGTETLAPVLTDKARELSFTNEGGAYGTIRLLKNIMGLWLLQEARNAWIREGREHSWPAMTEMTKAAAPFQAFIDPDDARFLAAGDMPARVRAYCSETRQPVPADDGALLRVITESLALKYRVVLDRLESLTGKPVEAFHMVGGGIQNELLCQFTANALGRPVLAGPTEGTAIGNLAVQMIAAGVAKDIADARRIVAASFPLKTYEPQEREAWARALAKFMEVTRG